MNENDFKLEINSLDAFSAFVEIIRSDFKSGELVESLRAGTQELKTAVELVNSKGEK